MPASSGNATRLDADVFAFLRRADNLLEQSSADDGRDAEIIENIVAQVHGHELSAARHVFASQTLQRAIASADTAHLVTLATPLFGARHAMAALTDKYASHVVEALLGQVLPSLQHASATWKDSEPSLAARLVSLVDVLLENDARALLTAMRDRYATHAVRTMLRVLSGRQPSTAAAGAGGGGGGRSGGQPYHSHGSAAVPAEPARVPVPPAFSAAVLRVCEALASTGQAARWWSLTYHASAAPVVHGLLLAWPPEGAPVLCAERPVLR
jgi:hypothetical protein